MTPSLFSPFSSPSLHAIHGSSPFMGFVLLVFFVACVTCVKLFFTKGFLGELFVRIACHLWLQKDIYRRVHNVTLRTPDGTTQIDHVVVSQFGIFVLETKNMKGWIFGSENQREWTQKIYRKSFKFQNPLRQNYKHLKALEAVLQIPAETLHSVIIFVGNGTLKTEMPPNVGHLSNLIRYIRSFRTPLFSENQVEDILSKIGAARLTPTFATHREHVLNLKTRSDPNAERKCPKCGRPLVLRVARNGRNAGSRFWGCSNYPKCQIVQNLS